MMAQNSPQCWHDLLEDERQVLLLYRAAPPYARPARVS